MHNAPAVTYPVGRSHFQVLLTLALLLLAAVVLVLWCFQAGHLGWRQALATGAWLVSAAPALRSVVRPASGVLRWDGQNWHWEPGGKALTGTVLPRGDWQAGVLLEFRAPAQRVHWLWLERGKAPLNWEAVRRALWAPGTAAGARQKIQAVGQP